MGIASTNGWPHPQVQDSRSALAPGNYLPDPNLLHNLHHHTAAAPRPAAAGLPQPTATGGVATADTLMERPAAAENQLQALRCPRCDSSNTKFCYYNNYSLSQPRHFCKACKRYWTRGGTLRNVPVGGGCRRTKRPKKPTSSASTNTTITNASAATTSNSTHSQILPSSDMISPLLYSSLQPNTTFSLYDLQPQMMSSLGLLFPTNNNIRDQDQQDYSSGFKPHLSQFHPQEPSSTILHDYSLLGSSPFSSSSFRQPPKLLSSSQAWSSYDQAAAAAIGGGFRAFKDVKEEESIVTGANYGDRLDWQAQVPCEISTPPENVGGGGGQNSFPLFWNPSVGGWPDAAAANCGSFMTPLI